MRRLFHGTAVNAMGRLLVYLIQLVIIGVVVRCFGKTALGVVVLAETIVNNKDLLESGFGVPATKYIAEYSSCNNNVAVKEVVSAAYFLTSVVAVLFCVVLVVLNKYVLIQFFKIPNDLINVSVTVISCFIAGMVFDLYRIMISRFLEGYQDFKVARFLGVVRAALWFLFMSVLLLIWKNVVVVGYAYLLASAISCFITLAIVVKYRPILFLDPKCLKRSRVISLIKFSGWIYLAKISTLLSRRAHVFILGYYAGVSSIAIYQIAYKIIEIANYSKSLITSAVVPFVSGCASDKNELRRTFECLAKISFYITGVLTVFLICNVDVIIALITRSGFEASLTPARIMLVAVAIGGITKVGAEMFVGIGKMKLLMSIALISCLIEFFLSIIFVQYWGVSGVAFGMLVSAFFFFMLFVPISLKEFEIPVVDFLFKDNVLVMLLILIVQLTVLNFVGTLWIDVIVSLSMVPLLIIMLKTHERAHLWDAAVTMFK